MTIRGSGRLTAEGGCGGAGIGSSSASNNGTVVIESGAIVTHGGRGGAGIGNGFIGSGGEITILGGVIIAKGGGCAAGIGGGESRFEETSGNIYIRGGIVYATSGGDSTGAGFGAGCPAGRGCWAVNTPADFPLTGSFLGPNGIRDWPVWPDENPYEW
ncbi:MAG: InlB B-repeat-containing protein [Treponematales bacterium]